MPEIEKKYKVTAFLKNKERQVWRNVSRENAKAIKRTLENGGTYSTDDFFLKGEHVAYLRIEEIKEEGYYYNGRF
mgnify:CR=1 FL=1